MAKVNNPERTNDKRWIIVSKLEGAVALCIDIREHAELVKLAGDHFDPHDLAGAIERMYVDNCDVLEGLECLTGYLQRLRDTVEAQIKNNGKTDADL